MLKFSGKSVFKGIAMGKVVVLKKNDSPVKRDKIEDADAEMARVQTALAQAKEQLGRLYDKALREVGEENAFIFGLSSDEVIRYENYGGYHPTEIFNNDPDVRKVLMQLINGTYAPNDPDLFRPLYNSLLNTQSTAKADTYFILKDFKAYAEAQKKVEAAYRNESGWAKSAILNVACSGKFTSDRTIQEYVDDIWKLDKVVIPKEPVVTDKKSAGK